MPDPSRRTAHQHLPRSGAARDALRDKGQFWTPDWVASAMVEYVLSDGSPHIFDPAVGSGAFFLAARVVVKEQGRPLKLLGTELYKDVLTAALTAGLGPDDLAGVEIRDFLRNPPESRFAAIVANPPYIRHHRLDAETKRFLKVFATSLLGEPLDGRTGYHVFFLLRALTLLDVGGRLAFIVPADTCEGVFANKLWHWITTHYCLDGVITFTPEATPFPGVDTNAVVLLLKNTAPRSDFSWARCKEPSGSLRRWVSLGQPDQDHPELHAIRRDIGEGIRVGLSREPAPELKDAVPLRVFAHVVRGIATGANDFFHLTGAQLKDLSLPFDYFIRAVGRTRDIEGEAIDQEGLATLDARGRPTFLLNIGADSFNELPASLRMYVASGEAKGLHQRALIGARRPWYKMERREPPEFFFAYLGRRNVRFIRNLAGVVPLTGFLCVYANSSNPGYVERLGKVLSRPETLNALRAVAKSYGGGAMKVEPRALERLPIRQHVLEEEGLGIAEGEPQYSFL